MLGIICFNEQHFRHLCHLYRFEPDDVHKISSVEDMRTLPHDAMIMYGDRWWERLSREEVDMIEIEASSHIKRRKRMKDEEYRSRLRERL